LKQEISTSQKEIKTPLKAQQSEEKVFFSTIKDMTENSDQTFSEISKQQDHLKTSK
jgi:hypothetical protein